jgi:hypothetical protein
MGQSLIGDFTGHICLAQEIMPTSPGFAEAVRLAALRGEPRGRCG